VTSSADAPVLGALVEAQERGFLGPGPVVAHLAHARHLLAALPELGAAVDLGSGGGVPGLILAGDRPALSWTFVESHHRRSAWLREAIAWLGLTNVGVIEDRVEAVGRGPARGAADLVTARSFAPPAVTAECGAPLLRGGGTLWVSEPPSAVAGRWPAAGLATLGLRRAERLVPSWAGLTLISECPDRYPRRVGIPAKRPLW